MTQGNLIPLEEQTRAILLAVDGKPVRFSPSAFTTWLQCRQRWYYRNVEKRPEPGNIYTVAGGAGHQALAALYSSRLRGQPIDRGELVRRYWAAYGVLRRSIVESDDPDVHEQDIVKRTADTLAWYFDEVSPIVHPQAVEVWLNSKLVLPTGREVEIVGRADLITTAGIIVDHKIVSYAPQTCEESDFMQLYWYAMLLTEVGQPPPPQCTFHYIVRGKDGPDFRAFAFQPEERGVERLRKLIAAWATDVADGRMSPNPMHPYCSPTGCPYWERCHDEW